MRIWQQYRLVDQTSDSSTGSIEHRARRYDYKPPALRLPALLSCLANTFALLGLLQYATLQLPQKDRFDIPWRDQATAQPQRSAVLRRQATYSTTNLPTATPTTAAVAITSLVASQTTTSGPSAPTQTFGVAPKSNYVDPDKTVTVEDGFGDIPQDDVETGTYGGQTADRSNYVATRTTVTEADATSSATSRTAYVSDGTRVAVSSFSDALTIRPDSDQ